MVFRIAASFGRLSPIARMTSSAASGSRLLMMSAIRAGPLSAPAAFSVAFSISRRASSTSSPRERADGVRRDKPAKGGVAAVARQRADDPGRKRRIQTREDVGGGSGPLVGKEADDCALGNLSERPPYVLPVLLAERRADELVDLGRGERLGEQSARLPGVAQQVRSRREIGGEFVDQPIERGGRNGAETGRRAREHAQIRLVEVLQQPARRRRPEHQQQRCGFFGAGEQALAWGQRLGHAGSQAACSRLAPATISSSDTPNR